MSAFTLAEIHYLQSQFLGRLATLGSDGQPHVVPGGQSVRPGFDAAMFRMRPKRVISLVGGRDR